MELPPETINSTLDAHDKINDWMDAKNIYGDLRSYIHDIVDEAVRNAHIFALAGAGSRILTVPEIADRLNLSTMSVRRRLAEASPPILPVKMIGSMPLFMVEDLPAIASAHMKGVIEDGDNTRYVAAKLRKAISQVQHRTVVKRLRADPDVRFPDIDGSPRVVRVEVSKSAGEYFEKKAKKDGWTDSAHLLRAFIAAYNELTKKKERYG